MLMTYAPMSTTEKTPWMSEGWLIGHVLHVIVALVCLFVCSSFLIAYLQFQSTDYISLNFMMYFSFLF